MDISHLQLVKVMQNVFDIVVKIMYTVTAKIALDRIKQVKVASVRTEK